MKIKIRDKKKKLKGMTLLEVLVAMMVFIITATLLVEAGVSVIMHVRTTRNLVRKVNYQAPIVASRSTQEDDVDIDEENHIEIGLMAVADHSATGNLVVNKIESKTETTVDEDDNEVPLYDDVAGNLKYFVPDPDSILASEESDEED